jgi:hypothetical protein
MNWWRERQKNPIKIDDQNHDKRQKEKPKKGES